jgi:DHA3 family macrolide efflux protein-like MFS transporter
MSVHVTSQTRSPAGSSVGLRTFAVIWFGQVISLLGSGLTSFALGLWVYQASGSVTQFALTALSATLPHLLLSPLAGSLADHWDRRRTMILSDLGAGLSTLAVAALLLGGCLQVWQVYLSAGVSAAFGAFQFPAYSAAIGTLVPRRHLGRANGLVQLGQAASEILAPLLAGALVGTIQVGGVIMIDCATFIFAVLTLLVVRIPQPPAVEMTDDYTQDARGAHDAPPAALAGAASAGWRFILAHPGLLGLLGFLAIFKFLWGLVAATITPMILGFADPAELGALLSIAGVGLLSGSLLMSAWGGPSRRILGVLLFEGLTGLCFVLVGLRPIFWTVALGVFGAHACIAVISGSSQTLWQSKVPVGLQGRVFAAIQMASGASSPLAYILAGPLAERVFEPLMAVDGPLTGSLGLVLGGGPGRGLALLLVCIGLLKLAVSVAGGLYPPLRRVEDELPDNQ